MIRSSTRHLFFSIVAALTQIAAAASYSPAVPIQEAISWEEYRVLLHETVDVANSLVDTSQDDVYQKLSSLATKWEEIDEVLLPDGESVPVNSSYLVVLLLSDPPNPGKVATLLAPALDRLDTGKTGVVDQTQLTGLKDILARPEFQWQQQEANPFQQAIQALFQWLLQSLANFFGSIPQGVGFVRWIMIVLGLSAIMLVMYFFWRGVFGDIVPEAGLENPLTPDEELLSAEEAFSRAGTLSKTGNLRDAVRLLYLSTLLSIEESGRFHFDRSLTNVEYLRRLKGEPDLANALRSIVGIFDRVWYGFEVIDVSTFDQYAQKVAELRAKK